MSLGGSADRCRLFGICGAKYGMQNGFNLVADDGHRFDVFRAGPAAAGGAGIVVLQEIFGVNAHMRSICDRLSALGYLALAPALYDRVQRDTELPYGSEGVARGRAIRQQLTDAVAMRDVAATVDAAAAEVGERGMVGVVGFCWGGTLAWLSATRLSRVDAAVAFYGTGIAGYLDETPRAPVQLHFGRHDASIPPADVASIRAAWPSAPLFEYDAGHGFHCDDRPAFEPTSARLAWHRAIAFLSRHASAMPLRAS